MIDSEKTDMEPFSGKMPGKESIHIFLKKEKKHDLLCKCLC